MHSRVSWRAKLSQYETNCKTFSCKCNQFHADWNAYFLNINLQLIRCGRASASSAAMGRTSVTLLSYRIGARYKRETKSVFIISEEKIIVFLVLYIFFLLMFAGLLFGVTTIYFQCFCANYKFQVSRMPGKSLQILQGYFAQELTPEYLFEEDKRKEARKK